MRITIYALTLSLVSLGWLAADFKWRYSKSISPPAFKDQHLRTYRLTSNDRPIYHGPVDCGDSRQAWQHQITSSACGQGVNIRERERLLRDLSREHVGDDAIVILTFVFTVIWIMMFAAILNGRFQRQLDHRYQELFAANIINETQFEISRRRG